MYSCFGVMFIVFNATFNNSSVISWRSVLLVEETEEYHRSDTSHRQIYHIKLPRHELSILVVIGID